jgi:hypothetical protein
MAFFEGCFDLKRDISIKMVKLVGIGVALLVVVNAVVGIATGRLAFAHALGLTARPGAGYDQHNLHSGELPKHL